MNFMLPVPLASLPAVEMCIRDRTWLMRARGKLKLILQEAEP